MRKIILTENRYTKKYGTKNGWDLEKSETIEIDEVRYNRITGDDTLKLFRRLGGSETAQRQYTSWGYKITRLISKSPNRENKTVRQFKFVWE